MRRTSADRVCAEPYPQPLVHLGLILSGFATTMLVWFLVDHYESLSTTDLIGIAATMTLTTIGLIIASVRQRSLAGLPYCAVPAGACGAVAWALAAASRRGIPPSPIILGLACGAVSLALAGLGDRLRGRTAEWLSRYRDPLLGGTFLAVLCAWGFGGYDWTHTRELTVILALDDPPPAVVIRRLPFRPLPDLVLTTGLATWLVGWVRLNRCKSRRCRALGS